MRGKSVARAVFGTGMVAMGVLHFTRSKAFERTVPAYLPNPAALVALSGACECAGGIGLLVPPTRRPAAIGLAALLLAVFPANIEMARHAERWVKREYMWTLIARLPLQAALIYWAWSLQD